MKTCSWVMALGWLVLTGCARPWESRVLGLRMELPPGVALQEEVAGPPAAARFSGGLEVRSVPGSPGDVDDKALEAFLVQALKGAGITELSGRVASARLGTLPVGGVARYEVKDGRAWALIYVVPLETRYLVVMLRTPEGSDGRRESQLERALASLAEWP